MLHNILCLSHTVDLYAWINTRTAKYFISISFRFFFRRIKKLGSLRIFSKWIKSHLNNLCELSETGCCASWACWWHTVVSFVIFFYRNSPLHLSFFLLLTNTNPFGCHICSHIHSHSHSVSGAMFASDLRANAFVNTKLIIQNVLTLGFWIAMKLPSTLLLFFAFSDSFFLSWCIQSQKHRTKKKNELHQLKHFCKIIIVLLYGSRWICIILSVLFFFFPFDFLQQSQAIFLFHSHLLLSEGCSFCVCVCAMAIRLMFRICSQFGVCLFLFRIIGF